MNRVHPAARIETVSTDQPKTPPAGPESQRNPSTEPRGDRLALANLTNQLQKNTTRPRFQHALPTGTYAGEEVPAVPNFMPKSRVAPRAVHKGVGLV